jgi:hypothetical protein
MTVPTSITRFPLAEGNGSARAVAVCADAGGLERFAYDLFHQAAEETAGPPQAATGSPRLAAALNPERLQQAAQRSRPSQVPVAYQLWISHLLWLEEVLRTLDWRPGDLTAVELAGLQAVGRARARFARSHQVCPHCEAVNPRTRGARSARCRRCREEF